MNAASLIQRLDNLYARTTGFKDSIGYPCNLELDYLAPLQGLLSRPLINVGIPSPEDKVNHALSTADFEREVIRFVARLYGLSEQDIYHGYITSGGTEANLYGLARARDDWPDATLYFSSSSHYSIVKSARLLGLKHRIIATQPAGEMDYARLTDELGRERPQSVILSLNIGTTMTGAIDRVETALAVLRQRGIERFHIHCDAALFGMMLPFLPDSPCPHFSQPIHSLAISGHKFLGCPFPCGMVITRRQPEACPIEYIHSHDTTLLGSRNGHAPVFLWYALTTRGLAGLKQEVDECIENARHLEKGLIRGGYPHFRNDYSNIVCLQKPGDEVIRKWNLAVEDAWAHVVAMQHVNRERLDRFLHDVCHF
ncbi:MAG: histidine decarboxylase [Methylococcaceae bacterium]